jgi:hypothetical protein
MTKEAAPGPKCGRRAQPEAEGTAPGKLWMPEEIGRHRAKVARRKINFVRKNWTMDKAV